MDRSEIRKIGGSDIAALLGLSKWKSAHSLYMHLIGKLPPQEETFEIRRGKKLEPKLANHFADEHEEYEVEEHGIVQHPDYDFIIGSPDRVLIQNGELVGGLEIKTADISLLCRYGEEHPDKFGQKGTDQLPVAYRCQCIWYAGLMGLDEWKLAVGFCESKANMYHLYQEYLIPFNQRYFDAMLTKAVEFWNEHVEKKIPPPITEADAATVDYYKHLYPQHEADKWAENDEEVDRLAELLLDCKKDLDGYEREYELLKTRFIAALQDKEGAKTPFGNFTYRASKPVKRIDWEGIVKHINVSSETIDRFTTETPGSRRFLIPKQKVD